jgi:hypothetical protein
MNKKLNKTQSVHSVCFSFIGNERRKTCTKKLDSTKGLYQHSIKCYTIFNMKKDILIIGNHNSESADCFHWHDCLPNPADYSVIILDGLDIIRYWSSQKRLESTGEHSFKLKKYNETDARIVRNLKFVKAKLIEMLEFPVVIYGLFNPNNIWSGEFLASVLTTNTTDWCPIDIVKTEENGTHIDVLDQSYKRYFEILGSWEFYINLQVVGTEQLTEHYQRSIRPEIKIIAKNKIDKPISFAFIPYFQSKSGKTQKQGGELVVLPVLANKSTAPLIENLLSKHAGNTRTPKPTWVDDILMPGENALGETIRKEKQALEDNQQLLHRLEESKSLLYETGIPLEEIVKSTFVAIGAVIEPSIVTDEFIINIQGKRVLAEVKGNTKSISKSDIAQLNIDTEVHFKKTNEAIKGNLTSLGASFAYPGITLYAQGIAVW